jgi:hypothetical protein
MAEKKEKNTITIDGVDHNFEDLTQEQQTMINHIADLERKISSSQFNLQQLEFGKAAFINALKQNMDAAEQEKSEENLVAEEAK